MDEKQLKEMGEKISKSAPENRTERRLAIERLAPKVADYIEALILTDEANQNPAMVLAIAELLKAISD